MAASAPNPATRHALMSASLSSLREGGLQLDLAEPAPSKPRFYKEYKSNQAPIEAWPPPDFVKKELPSLGATQIMAVRIDRSGAPLGHAVAAASASGAVTSTRKQKSRGVTNGGWRTGVTAVKFACECGLAI